MTSLQPSKTFSVLLVDDEPTVRGVIRALLTASGFAVEEVETGTEAVDALKRGHFDLVLIDLNMPGTSGVEACRQVRAVAPRAGIVVVTVLGAEEEQVRALDAGADDCVTKPIRFRELVARLGAVLRRIQKVGDRDSGVLEAGDLKLEVDRHRLSKRGEQIRLSRKEFDLLAYLMKNRGAPMTHVKLLRAVWGPEYGGELEYLRSYIRMLRKKIEDDPSKPEYILTEAWVGYRFSEPVRPGSVS